MKKLFLVFSIVLSLFAANVFARGGGGFSSGRSSFSSGRSSYSSGRSSFSSGRSSTPPTSKGSGTTTSSRGWFGTGKSKPSTSRPGMGDLKASQYSAPRTYTTREVLQSSTRTVYTPYNPVPIYYYYYPSPFYGSGYGFYNWYFWSHMWGNHAHCYHQGGGMAPPVRKCDKDSACYDGEKCNAVKQCELKK